MDEHRKLVVTDAGDRVGPSYRPGQAARQFHKHRVGGEGRDVDRSEAGEMEGDQPVDRRTPRAGGQGPAHIVEEHLPAQQACQSIAEGSP